MSARGRGALRLLLGRTVSAVQGPEVSPRRVRRFLEQMREVPRPAPSAVAHESVAIVIPCYGHAKYVATALESVFKQTRPPDEVVVVDDASADDSRRMVESTIAGAEDDVGIRWKLLVNDRNIGQAASLNRAIDSVASDLVLVLNDDDYLMHDIVETMLHLFRAHPDIALIGAHSVHFRSDAELHDLPRTIAQRTDGRWPELIVRRPADVLAYRRYSDLNMTHTGSCFLRSAWATVGGYASDRRQRIVPFSDRDFQLRVNALFTVGLSPVVPFSFWREGSSVDHERNT